jgi:hypothetical protein
MNNLEIYLNKKSFEDNKKDYLRGYKEECPNEEEEYDSYVLKPNTENIEFEYIDNEIKVSVNILDKDRKYVGTMSFYLEVDSEMAADIIEAQVKKFNKIKTILEATK